MSFGRFYNQAVFETGSYRLCAEFKDSDWKYLIREGLRPDNGWECGLLMLRRRVPDFIRDWIPFLDSPNRMGVLRYAWGKAIHTDALREFLIYEASRPDAENQRTAVGMLRMDENGTLTSNLLSNLKIIAATQDSDTKQSVVLALEVGRPVSAGGHAQAREILLGLSKDADPHVAQQAKDALALPSVR